MREPFPSYSIGHFINQAANRGEFEITRFEEMEEPNVEDVHRHTFYEILWVDEGTSRQTIDFQSYDLRASSLFFICPGRVHEFEAWQGLKGGTIMFTDDFFLQNQQNNDKLFELSFLNNIYFNPCLLLESEEYAVVRHYIDLLLKERKRVYPEVEILRSLLQILLLQVQRCVASYGSAIPSKRNIMFFKQLKNLLELNFTEALTVRQYAEKLNITQHHLNRIVKDITGRSASEFIKARSILEAKRMLSFTSLSVSEIASHLSYFDSSYFSKTFKAATGKTPIQFKMEMSGKYRKA